MHPASQGVNSRWIRENFASSRGTGVFRQPELHRTFCRFGAIANSDPYRHANGNAIAIADANPFANSTPASSVAARRQPDSDDRFPG